MFLRLYLFYLYICNKLKIISYNNYYIYSYDEVQDVVDIKNITNLYYMLMILFLTNNKRVLNYFQIKKNNMIVKNNNDQIFLLDKNNFSKSIVPTGIIDNIKINIKNHRYDLENFKRNIFKIDHSTPIIFCLAYYENIKRVKECNLTLEYKKFFNKLDKPLQYKVRKSDILENLFKNV